MLQAARLTLGYPGQDDDEADALWVLAWARSEYADRMDVARALEHAQPATVAP
jgi:hypothetical protein